MPERPECADSGHSTPKPECPLWGQVNCYSDTQPTPGQDANWHPGGFLDTHEPSGHCLASIVQAKRYPVRLDWTPCNFGGRRAWFLCPAMGCEKRVAILYSGSIFAFRHCYQLAYPSQREPTYDRVARKADKIRERLGWKQGILNPRGWKKPKGMH